MTWLRERQLISAGRAQQLAENSERSHARINKPWKHIGMLAPMILALMIPTGAIDATERRICFFEFQVLGTGAGVFCDEPAGPDVVDTSCQAFEPIRYSRTDTDETRQQIREHNAAWDVLCKEKK